jgi:glycosyltransferase involved in cell wall biosynthesis
MAAEVRREYGVGVEKIRVIHNFSERQAAESREKEPFFFGAGRVWDPAKNFALLEQVAPHVQWPIRLAGKDREGAASPAALEKLGQIPTADLLGLMARASVFVHPALYEPFGLSVLDAARARCCLVLADTPSLRELWNEAAIFLDPRDPKAWVEELNSLSRDAVRCREMGARGSSRAERYSADLTVRAYQDMYTELIAQAGTRTEEAA